MEVRSIYKYARVSPLKARDVAREIQGLPVSQALDVLTFTPRKAAQIINKTLKSAVANAENNHELSIDSLVVKEATVGKGPTFKRFKPRARGSASAIKKPTSHIRIILTDEFEAPEPKRSKGAKGKKPRPKTKAGAAAAATGAPGGGPAEPAADDAGSGIGALGVTRLDDALGVVYEEAPAAYDDLQKINGVGPALEQKLHESGVYTFRQIANWTPGNAEAFGELLSAGDRIGRDGWIEQAKSLHLEAHGEEI
jgi:large subunit ribosomal protein L22